MSIWLLWDFRDTHGWSSTWLTAGIMLATSRIRLVDLGWCQPAHQGVGSSPLTNRSSLARLDKLLHRFPRLGVSSREIGVDHGLPAVSHSRGSCATWCLYLSLATRMANSRVVDACLVGMGDWFKSGTEPSDCASMRSRTMMHEVQVHCRLHVSQRSGAWAGFSLAVFQLEILQRLVEGPFHVTGIMPRLRPDGFIRHPCSWI